MKIFLFTVFSLILGISLTSVAFADTVNVSIPEGTSDPGCESTTEHLQEKIQFEKDRLSKWL